MRNNIIKGIKPFNDLYFRSCYYHQLLVGLSAFNIDKDEVLLSFYTLSCDNFKFVELDFNNNKNYQKSLSYKLKAININRNKLVKLIDKGYPLIIGIDCFYLESKEEAYKKLHEPHFILAYGYDLDKDEVNIVEHDYKNDYNYTTKVISLSNLLLANKKFKYISKRNKTCRIIMKNDYKKSNYSIWKYLTKEVLENSFKSSKNNLDKLSNMISNNSSMLLDNQKVLSDYLLKMKMNYYLINQTNLFASIDISNTLDELTNAYSFILSLMWKIGYVKNTKIIEKNKESILRKINEIICLEEKIKEIIIAVPKK
jgi:hypothetical protein